MRFTAGEERLSRDQEMIEGLDNHEHDRLFPMEMPYVRESVELVQGATEPFDIEKFLAGEQSPVFFGSGVNNFGVQDVLDALVQWAPPPQPREAGVRKIEPTEAPFSGFGFKTQANMDPRHRDRIAFLRICSGKFERGMDALHVQEGKNIKLATGTSLMADDRAIVDEAYAGDIIGLFDPGIFSIGDTLCTGKQHVQFAGIPTFAPEHFARVTQVDTMKRKQFVKGIEQIAQEGAIEIFKMPDSGFEDVVVGVVGTLQFDVFEYRMKSEYGVELRMSALPYEHLRLIAECPGDPKDLMFCTGSKLLEDFKGRKLIAFGGEWSVGFLTKHNPGLVLDDWLTVSK